VFGGRCGPGCSDVSQVELGEFEQAHVTCDTDLPFSAAAHTSACDDSAMALHPAPGWPPSHLCARHFSLAACRARARSCWRRRRGHSQFRRTTPVPSLALPCSRLHAHTRTAHAHFTTQRRQKASPRPLLYCAGCAVLCSSRLCVPHHQDPHPLVSSRPRPRMPARPPPAAGSLLALLLAAVAVA